MNNRAFWIFSQRKWKRLASNMCFLYSGEGKDQSMLPACRRVTFIGR
jgi:hypothetical protein